MIKHNLSVFHKLHVDAIIDRAKLQHVEQFSSNSTSSSIIVSRTLNLQPEYRYAEYLSSVRCFSNRRLLSRFRCGCHGLHLDTGRWVDTKREDRLCQVCHSSRDVEDEQHFLFRKRLDQSKSPRVRLQRLEKCLDQKVNIVRQQGTGISC